MKRTIVLELEDLQIDSIKRESELAQSSAKEISNLLGPIVVDAFTRYVEAKNIRWHLSGRHFRDYGLHLGERSERVPIMTDDVAEQLTVSLRAIQKVCQRHNDVATGRLVETWIGETERRTWFPFEIKETL